MKNKLPVGALRLVEGESSLATCFAEGEDKKLKMQIYSGKPITDHWYWGSLVIDLQGMSAQGSKFPILEDHMTDKKIGFTAKPLVTQEHSLQVDPDKTTFVSTPESEAFQKLSAEGFPYQASVRGTPTEIQKLGEKETAQVNGFDFKGPGFIWRKWEFKEGSVTVFGADSKTKSSAFAEKEDVDIDIIGEIPEGLKEENTQTGVPTIGDKTLTRTKRKEKSMEFKDVTLTQLKEECPDLFKEIQDNASEATKAEMENQFSEREVGIEDKITKLTAQVEKAETINSELQKKDVIRSEKAMKTEADYAFTEALQESNLDERLYEKVRPMVNHSDFIEDGQLDMEKFKEAVLAEIKTWEDSGITTSSSVKGFSPSGKEVDTGDDTFSEKDTEDAVDAMLAHTSHKKE